MCGAFFMFAIMLIVAGKNIAKMEREILKLDSEQGELIAYGDSDEFEIVRTTIRSVTRWSIHKDIIVKRLSDGKLFESFYSQGATEQQDESPYEYSDAIFKEVKEVQKTIKDYEWPNP